MLLVRYQLGPAVLFIASILDVITAARCPFRGTSQSRVNCKCNQILQEIICSDLDAVPDFSMLTVSEFRTLHLKRGRIGVLGPSAFDGLPQLVRIIVDFNPLNVGGLHEAMLQPKRIDNVVDKTQSPLRELTIGASRLQLLPPKLLSGLGHLRRLSLWGNELHQLPAGFFDPVVSSLVELSLWGNRLERLDETTLAASRRQYWTSLRTLDLDRNLISVVGRHVFRSMPNVETLRLAGNRIAGLTADALTGLIRLRSLRLEHNGLGFIHSAAFVGLESLLSLSLSDNVLAFLPDGLFASLGMLVDLHLQNNRLEYVWWRTFRGLRSLRRIDLSGNRLSNLPDDVFRHSTRLSVLSLDDNHLRTLRRCSLPPVDAPPSPTHSSPPPSVSGFQLASWRRSRRRRTLSLLGNVSLRCDCRLAWLAAQVDGGVTAVWGSCDLALDPPQASSLLPVDRLLGGRCPIAAVVLRQRFHVCPLHTQQQTHCKTS